MEKETPAGSFAWRVSCARDDAAQWLGKSVTEINPYPGTVGRIVGWGLCLLVAGETDLARRCLSLAAEAGEYVLRNQQWPRTPAATDEPSAKEREQAAELRGESEVCHWLSFATWLLGEPWPEGIAARAADLEVRAHGSRVLRLMTPWSTLQLLANSGQAARGVELYRTCVSPRKHLPIPPESGRYAANHLDAMYVVCLHLSGEAGLDSWAELACRRWLKPARAWHLTDPKYQDRERLAWMRLWQAHFGGPKDVEELAATMKPQ